MATEMYVGRRYTMYIMQRAVCSQRQPRPINIYVLHIPKSIQCRQTLPLCGGARQRQTSGMLAMATSGICFTLGFTLVITYALLVKESTGGKVKLILLLLSLTCVSCLMYRVQI